LFRSSGSPEEPLRAKVTYLEDTNFLLNSRVDEKEQLIADTVQDLRQQMQMNIQASELAQKLFLENAQLMQQLKRREESQEAWNELRQSLLALCSELI
jgi:hypothetical protein